MGAIFERRERMRRLAERRGLSLVFLGKKGGREMIFQDLTRFFRSVCWKKLRHDKVHF